MTAEEKRLEEDRTRKAYWRRWGPYLSKRQWGTVREDYSPYGTAWGSISLTIMSVPLPIAGVKMVLVGFLITIKDYVSQSRFGMVKIRYWLDRISRHFNHTL